MLGHRHAKLTVLAVAALAGLTGGVAIAASTDTLPFAAGGGQTTRASATSQTATTPTPASTAGTAPAPAPANGPSTSSGKGPDATGPAKFGLCNAYTSGQGTTNGNKADATAFQALATAAGGADNIASFCADATPGGGNAPSGDRSTPPVSAPPGAENGQGAEHANPASNGHVPGNDAGSQGQSHRP